MCVSAVNAMSGGRERSKEHFCGNVVVEWVFSGEMLWQSVVRCEGATHERRESESFDSRHDTWPVISSSPVDDLLK